MILRVDEASVRGDTSTFLDDLAVLTETLIRPVVVAPEPAAARDIVRAINRSTNTAVALSGSDAAMLPHAPGGIGRIQTGILTTLLDAGYVPVVEPTGFSVFAKGDAPLMADDVATAIALALEAVRAIFFHASGGISDPQTDALIAELTPAEALELAQDTRVARDLRDLIRVAALGVRGGLPVAQILDGRVPHATIVELLTSQPVGTRVTGSVTLAA